MLDVICKTMGVICKNVKCNTNAVMYNDIISSVSVAGIYITYNALCDMFACATRKA